MVSMVISVRKSERDGRYWASRSFEGLGADHISSGRDVVFVLTQKEDESIPDFEDRARREARERGIAGVE